MNSDVLTVLDEQTKQAEVLIDRLSKRLDRTRELKTLEQERHQLAQKMAGMEQRLTELNGEITHWRELSQRKDDDGQDVIRQLEEAWSDIVAGGVLRAPTTSLLAPAPKPRIPVDEGLTRADWPEELDGGEPEIPETDVVTDALDVLDSFFSDFSDETPVSKDTAWHDGDFFSAAQGLQDDPTEADWLANGDNGAEDDWWQPGNESALLPEQEAVTEPPILMDSPPTEQTGKSARRGLLGRFF